MNIKHALGIEHEMNDKVRNKHGSTAGQLWAMANLQQSMALITAACAALLFIANMAYTSIFLQQGTVIMVLAAYTLLLTLLATCTLMAFTAKDYPWTAGLAIATILFIPAPLTVIVAVLYRMKIKKSVAE